MVKRRVHIVTVGASLISNGIKHENIKSIVGGTDRLAEIEERLRSKGINRNELHKALLNLLMERGEEVSAEVASMSKFLKEKKVDLAYLLYTDTELGELCSRALESYLRKMGIDTQREKVEGYQDEESFSKEGLMNLAMRSWGLIKRHKKSDRICVCATGGYKPETAFLTLMANLQGVPVYYRHESFRTHVAIPGMPIEWRYEIIGKFKDAIMELINKRVSKEEFHKRFGKDLAEEMEEDYWLIRQVNGDYEITPMGRLLYHVLLGG